ncbi:MAG: helix-turn-helix transcriptional regulator [Candidatus Thermoplasmatota archaeon]|uniref:winged helix-turn-helix transcriptional regulator n=1 Tax=Ferroplasma sp. TaxID=2591003 RepID=UPI0003895F28|nr:helix-turn-helix domain-containing protein [Ferroplasma sp.]EQB73186.1 MAG: transcriptional regulator [Ferroplasma sp. Type II]MCL4311080.1 helix-turn-helix transcriptional regulator [Candidatus Thermoplasmatota archaeon]HIH59631.1 helix-turn-helix transcriptional regulator [Ferroplasma sp.]HII83122.1 helix-turn-helix transcriptional regulator [Ferroplasma sp.]
MTYLELKEIGSGKDFLSKYSDIMRLWAVPVILSIGRNGEAGFNQIKREVKGINSTTLSSTLGMFEKYGFLARVIIPSKPVRVKYSLTEKGRKFYGISLDLASMIEDL